MNWFTISSQRIPREKVPKTRELILKKKKKHKTHEEASQHIQIAELDLQSLQVMELSDTDYKMFTMFNNKKGHT